MSENISAPTTASHTPLSPQINGRIKMNAIWKTRVRKNEITAEIRPLLSAVKNADAKIFIPLMMYESEKRQIALVVISCNSLL